MNIKDAKGFSEEIVSYISETKKEPQWMKELRLDSWGKYNSNPIPDSNDESWRRTDISSLNLAEIHSFNDDNLSVDDTATSANQAENRIIHRNSSVVHNRLSKDLEDKGVIFTDMDSALKKYPELIKEYFVSNCVNSDHDVFALLHLAFWSGGTFLYVPANVEIDIPFSSLVTLNRPGSAVFHHTLIVLEESSKALFQEELQSESTNPQSAIRNPQSISSGIVEMYLKDGACLDYFSVQDWGTDVYSFSAKRVVVNRDSSMKWTECAVGSKLAKSDFTSILKGQGANTNMLGLSFTNGNQHLDTSATVHHTAPNTNGNILIKGVADGNAKTVFQGLIKIDPGAQHTDSYMGNHNLLLSDNAKADSIPVLEIEADEIKATHGVTVGQVDKEQMFYLMSRGLNESDAKKLIADGFFESIINMVTQEYARDSLRHFIDKKRKRND
ncbi:MAG: Fe-S cluster assembly protein SufD [Candidatus Anammoxibacter sp.]